MKGRKKRNPDGARCGWKVGFSAQKTGPEISKNFYNLFIFQWLAILFYILKQACRD
ncbi:hypothetical protein [Eoetvoesiella caeni]